MTMEVIDRPKNCIEVTTWRCLGDDDDTLVKHVFGSGDQTDVRLLIDTKESTESAVYWGDDDDAERDGVDLGNVAQGITVAHTIISDGDVFTSHDGRQFRVQIEQVSL